ncbi:MAG: hypothetical protein OSB83_07085 [Planctomycetota bacterium]|nr:hypothetical protein [Planctomycetota bacterium]
MEKRAELKLIPGNQELCEDLPQMNPELDIDPGVKLADPRLGEIESLADFPHGQLFAAGQDNDQPVSAVEPSRDELANFLLFERALVIKSVLVMKSKET